MIMNLKIRSKKEIGSWNDAFKKWYKNSYEYLGDISTYKIKKE